MIARRSFRAKSLSEAGFSLVELMITMAVFIFAVAAGSQVFTVLLTQAKQQTKQVETNIEGIAGLEILRRDIEHAGYGLPWSLCDGCAFGYQEAAFDGSTPWVDRDYNDGPPDNPLRQCGGTLEAENGAAPYYPPGAIRSGNNLGVSNSSGSGYLSGSGADVLIIKALNVANNAASQRWSYLRTGDEKERALSGDAFEDDDYVIVVNPTSDNRELVRGPGWYTTYSSTSNFDPDNSKTIHTIYGIKPRDNPQVIPRMPFNRADYYIKRSSTVPARCAPNSGTLYKATLNHSNGAHTEFPLLDCVADMQIIYRTATGYTDYISDYSAECIRKSVKEIRVYILAHEGQRDATFTYPTQSIYVGEYALGRNFELGTNRNYRWKIYNIIVEPKNLGLLK